MSDTPQLHPNISEVIAELDRARGVLRDAVDTVPESQRATRPADGRWSVNEILEHLAMVERRFTEVLATRIEEAKALGLGEERIPRAALPPD